MEELRSVIKTQISVYRYATGHYPTKFSTALLGDGCLGIKIGIKGEKPFDQGHLTQDYNFRDSKTMRIDAIQILKHEIPGSGKNVIQKLIDRLIPEVPALD